MGNGSKIIEGLQEVIAMIGETKPAQNRRTITVDVRAGCLMLEMQSWADGLKLEICLSGAQAAELGARLTKAAAEYPHGFAGPFR